MSPKPLRAGVIGLRRGLNFVRLLQAMEDVELVVVADTDSQRLERVCREHNVAHGSATLPELLRHDLDFLVVATPLPCHVAQAIEALDAGVHVLSEVPAAATVDECYLLIQAVERSGRHYMLAENCCYWAITDVVRQWYRRGTFGELLYGEAEYIHHIPDLRHAADGTPTWRASLEPIVYCTHSLGPILWISGTYPTEVSCMSTGAHFDTELPDLQTALFKLDNGGVARVTCSFANSHWGGHRYALFGTHASLDTGWVGKDEPRFWSRDLPQLQRPVSLPIGADFPNLPAAAKLGGHGTAEWRMISAVLEALRTDSPPPIDVYDAVMFSLPGLVAKEAAASGQTLPIPQLQRRRASRMSGEE